MTRTYLSVFIAAIVIGMSACDGPTLPPTTQGGGWILETSFIPLQGPISVVPGVTVGLNWNHDNPGAAGDASPRILTTNGIGLAAVTNGRAPAQWHYEWQSPIPREGCFGVTATADVTPNRVEDFHCIEMFAATSSFSVTPNPIFQDAPPQSVTILGSGFSSQYGMPLIQYYSPDGTTLVDQTSASAVGSDGSWLQAPTPNLSGVSPGTYAGLIKNANSSAGWDVAGAAAVTVEATDCSTSSPAANECRAQGSWYNWSVSACSCVCNAPRGMSCE